MPKWMKDFLASRSLQWHLLLALGIGLFLRALSAHFVYGPQALDDYKHGVWPAYQLFVGEALNLPNYRSHLLVWILSGFLRVASWFGAESALTQVRSIYLGLGILSLLGIYGAYLYARNFRSQVFGAFFIYLMAAQGLMPFIGTRAFGEALAVPFVMLGFGLMEDQRLRAAARRKLGLFWLGALVLAFACFLRFQVGILVLAYGACLIYMREWRLIVEGVVAGALALAAQVGVDVLSGKEPLETIFVYLRENEGGAAKYGVSPWYNTWLFVLALTLFPFSLVFFKELKLVWRKHWPILIPLLSFVLIHSFVAHKEERFLYPIVGLVWLVLAAAWAEAKDSIWARRLYSPVFLTLNTLILLAACFVNTQEGEIEPAAYAEKKYKNVLYLDYQSLFGQSRILFYFLRPPSVLLKIEAADIGVNPIDDHLRAHPNLNAAVVMTSDEPTVGLLRALENIKTVEAQCEGLREAGSLVDRTLYHLNPKHNQRRRPTWYLVCSRSQQGV